MTKLKNLFIKIKEDPGFLVVMIVAIVLRLVNLGYSDFQGDEIKALFLPGVNESWYEFLLTQRKGPLQFLITFLIKFLDPNYINQFLVRLPFAIAGILAVLYFYKLVKTLFTKKIAFYASFLMATNGFFIAFSRIAQYQSFVILFSVLAVYELYLAATTEKHKKRGIYLAALFWALSILAHYDGAFIAPIMAFLAIRWFKSANIEKKEKISISIKALGIFMLMNLSFYIPFVLYISQGTTSYWLGRLSGDASSKLSSSYYLFTVYQPIYVIHFYTLFFASGIASLIAYFIKPMRYVSSLADTLGRNNFLAVLAWFVLPFIFWEVIVYISGTHIYSYILPGFVIIAHGLTYLENIWNKITVNIRFIKPNLIKTLVISLVFVFITAQVYYIYVDNYREYPWQEEKFLLWTFPPPTPSYHLSMFGFPYFRDWENISKYISQQTGVTHYSTNERESISRHYINLRKDANLAGFYIFIRFSQSFTNDLTNEKISYWAAKYPPIYTMSRNGLDLVNIYLMEPGGVDEIKLKGY